MNIGFIVSDISLTGGVEIATKQMAECESKKGNRIFIITCRNTGNESSDKYQICNINLPAGITVLNKHHIRKICSVVEKASVSRVMIQLNDPHKICLLANILLNKELSRLTEVFVTIHSSPKSALMRYRLYNEKFLVYKIKQIYSKTRYNWYAKKYVKKSEKYIKSFITLSVGCQKELKTYFGADSIVRYNPYLWQIYDENIRKNNTVLWAGRLERDKNVYLLLDAWKQTDHCGWKLKIIGDGSDKQEILNYIKSEKISDIKLTGELSHEKVLCEMMKSKIFVFTSFHEGFPNVITEALNMKNAVIAVRYDGFSDELLKKENCVCVGYCPKEIAYNLEKLMDDAGRLKQMQEKGYLSCFNFYKKIQEQTPLVTVLMSVYNENPAYLKEAADSIINQTYKNLEIIIVNDFCSGICSSMLEDYAHKDRRIILIKNTRNLGLTKSLNIGLEKARGKYIARMDSDDIADPERIEHQVQQMEKDDGLTVCGTWAGGMDYGERLCLMRSSDDNEILAVRMMLYNAGVIHPTAMIRTAFLKENNIRYDEKYARAQDYALWSDIIYSGGRIVTLPKVLLRYRTHAGQASSAFREEQNLCTRRIRIRNLERHLKVSLSIREKELFHALTENNMLGFSMEDIKLIKKIQSNAEGINPGLLQKELLMQWWIRGIISIKNKERMNAGYFFNRYALSVIRPDNLLYAVRFFVLKL